MDNDRIHLTREIDDFQWLKFNYVISDSCEYAVKNDTIVVEEGDSHYFDASALYMAADASRRSGVSIHSILPEK